jgi:ABC-2 type transport system permease protein
MSTVDIRLTVLDGWTLVRRNLAQLRHQPGQIVAMLMFPAIMVVLFGFVFGSAITVPGGGNYREYLMPGLFVMTCSMSLMGGVLAVATDNGRGVMDRFRSMPMSRVAVPFGHTGADLLTGLLGLAIMLGSGLLFGWRAHNGFGATVGAIALLVLFRYAMAWAGVFCGLLVKNEGTAEQLAPVILPFSMISNSFVPTGGMPAWLRTVADWNPVSAVVAACRTLFGNPGVATENLPWPMAHPVTATIGWSLLLLVIFVPLAVYRFGRAGR